MTLAELDKRNISIDVNHIIADVTGLHLIKQLCQGLILLFESLLVILLRL